MKSVLKITACTADHSLAAATPQAWAAAICARVQAAWEAGAEVVLLPEFLWLGLERFAPGLAATAALFWESLWPEILQTLHHPSKCVVLGTVPWPSATGLRNRAVIVSEGQPHFQDKLYLTPWEKALEPGLELRPWRFQGWQLAVLVCLDVEMPEHSVALRSHAVDVLLVPSATENELGVERIARCASARAVELGCHVIVSPLVGVSESALVDQNLGTLSCYSPAQAAFRQGLRLDAGPLQRSGWHQRTWELAARDLQRMRRNHRETNPALVQMPKE